MTFTVLVARAENERQKVYGPFETHDEAYKCAMPFAEEGLDVEIRSTEPICDFCSRHEVAWAYTAKDFVPTDAVPWGSRGGWGACDGCHELIEKDDYLGLAERSLDNFAFEEQGIPNNYIMRSIVFRSIQMMHAAFRSMRYGPAIRVEDSEEFNAG